MTSIQAVYQWMEGWESVITKLPLFAKYASTLQSPLMGGFGTELRMRLLDGAGDPTSFCRGLLRSGLWTGLRWTPMNRGGTSSGRCPGSTRPLIASREVIFREPEKSQLDS